MTSDPQDSPQLWKARWLPDDLVPREGRWVIVNLLGQLVLQHDRTLPRIHQATALGLAARINVGSIRVRNFTPANVGLLRRIVPQYHDPDPPLEDQLDHPL